MNLHFKNGVYELDKKRFRKRRKTDYITKFLDWNYDENVDEDIYNEVDLFFSKIQPKAEQKKFSLQWLAYCLTGKTNKTKFKMNIGYKASNGKTTEFTIHESVFNIYSHKIDSKTFNENNSKKHKQIIHLLNNPIRFCYCEELGTDRLDSSFLKDFVDGKNVVCEVMYGTSIDRAVQCKLNTCSNKDFNLDMDGGVKRRGLVQLYESKFIDQNIEKTLVDDFEKNIFIKDDEYSFRFEDEKYKNAYLKLLINNFDSNFNIPSTNSELFEEIGNQYDEIGPIFNENYEQTDSNDDFVSKQDIFNLFKEKLNKNNLSWRYLLGELKSKGLKFDRLKMINGVRGFFIGIKAIELIDE